MRFQHLAVHADGAQRFQERRDVVDGVVNGQMPLQQVEVQRDHARGIAQPGADHPFLGRAVHLRDAQPGPAGGAGQHGGVDRGGGRMGFVRVVVSGLRRMRGRGVSGGVPRGWMIVAAATAATTLGVLGVGVVVRGHRRGRMWW